MNRFRFTEINEPVKVGAVFEKAKIKPKWFIWNGKKFNLREITYSWIDSSRGSKHHFFTVWDGSNLYEISLNSRFMTWNLEKVYVR